MNKQTYFSFTEKGKEDLPSKEEILYLESENTRPIIFIDSCVCLDIVKTINYRNKVQSITREKVLHLKEYLTDSKIRLKPMFGLIELCYEQGRFNEKKFWEFNNRIKYFEDIPLKYFHGYKYNFDKDFFLLFTSDLGLQSTFNALESYYLNAYCALLKIRALALKGLSKTMAKRNITDFFNWMVDELGIVLGLEYFLSLKIFGGSSEYRKMIWLDGKQEIIKKKLVGSSWDIFHARLSTNTFEFNKLKLIDNKKVYTYFLTNDLNLFNLFAYYSLFCVIEKADDTGTMRLFNSDLNVPHLDNKFIDDQNRKIFEALSERVNKKIENNPTKTKLLIQDLEKKNNIA
jgi:hypothetical protein